MKTYKYIILLLFLIIGLNACKKEDLPEFPGSLIKHIINIEMPGSDMEKASARMYAFSGNHDNDLSSLPEGDWTYELWIKVDPNALIGGKNVRNGYYAGGACIGSREHNFELYLINDPDADFAIKYGKLRTGDGVQVASMQSDGATENLHFDEWVHVAISRSSTDGIAKFYINGKLIDSSSNPIWIQTSSDEWLTFNYMKRNGYHKHFFKGGMDNIRVSTINRYPSEFTPNRKDIFKVDENTLLQLDLQEHLTSFNPPTDYKKIEIKGTYDYYIKVHNNNIWHHDPDEYLPLGDYKNN